MRLHFALPSAKTDTPAREGLTVAFPLFGSSLRTMTTEEPLRCCADGTLGLDRPSIVGCSLRSYTMPSLAPHLGVLRGDASSMRRSGLRCRRLLARHGTSGKRRRDESGRGCVAIRRSNANIWQRCLRAIRNVHSYSFDCTCKRTVGQALR